MISFLLSCEDEGLTTLFHLQQPQHVEASSGNECSCVPPLRPIPTKGPTPTLMPAPAQSLYQACWLAGGTGSSGHVTRWSNHSPCCTPSHLSGVQSKDIRFAGCCKKKENGCCETFSCIFFFLSFFFSSSPQFLFGRLGWGLEVSALLCSNSKYFLYKSALNLHQSLHHIKLTGGIKIMILLCTCQNVQTWLSLYAN